MMIPIGTAVGMGYSACVTHAFNRTVGDNVDGGKWYMSYILLGIPAVCIAAASVWLRQLITRFSGANQVALEQGVLLSEEDAEQRRSPSRILTKTIRSVPFLLLAWAAAASAATTTKEKLQWLWGLWV
eukprot:GHVN01060013.1.p1 GENE.GHVN01060013.1~~GHVN01060013.1.p1  ORF type:complete len:128 (+),score=11.82 GHVN01060013.1:453-836(+)